MGIVLFPLGFVGIHLLLSYWLGKDAPLRYAIPVVLGLSLLVSLVWYALTFALLFGYSEAYLGLDYRPLDSLRSETLFSRTLVLPLDPCSGNPELQRLLGPASCGYLGLWPLPLMLFAVGLLGLVLTRWGWKTVLTCLLLFSAAGLAYSLQPVRLTDAAPAQGVSLYPDAQQVMVTADRSRQWRQVTFISGSAPEDVLTFYQRSLPAAGWQSDESHKYGADLLFIRPSSAGVVPRNDVVSVVATPALTGANVLLGIDQWVNIRHWPLYPQTEEPAVSEAVDADGELTRPITLRTAAPPDAVIAYYEDLRNQAGYMGFAREIIADGLQARLTASAATTTRRTAIATTNVEILITARPAPAGPTHVTIAARGPDLP